MIREGGDDFFFSDDNEVEDDVIDDDDDFFVMVIDDTDEVKEIFGEESDDFWIVVPDKSLLNRDFLFEELLVRCFVHGAVAFLFDGAIFFRLSMMIGRRSFKTFLLPCLIDQSNDIASSIT